MSFRKCLKCGKSMPASLLFKKEGGEVCHNCYCDHLKRTKNKRYEWRVKNEYKKENKRNNTDKIIRAC
jgi:recombinational DNA repair protein (RecF pathway)